MFYCVPDVTTNIGLVGKNGKQSISVYENDGARHVYITDKSKIDEFQKRSVDAQKDLNKAGLGFGGALALGISSPFLLSSMFGRASKTCKVLGFVGLAASALSAIYAVVKYGDYKESAKQQDNALNEIKKSNCIK